MRRLLGVILAGAAVLASERCAFAFKKPDLPELPNIDKRRENRPARPELPPGKAVAAAVLQERLPGAKVSVDQILETPSFVHSRFGFLTGPRGRGGAVANAIARADAGPHGPVRAFLNEHSALFGFGEEALDLATIKRDYVTRHNGLRTTVWAQHLNQIPILDAVFMAHITRDGELVNVSSRFVADPARATRGRPANPRMTALEALLASAKSLGEDVAAANVTALDAQPVGPVQRQRFRAAPQLNEAQTELVWVPLDSELMVLCWDVRLASRARGETFRVVVNADTGEVIIRQLLTLYISDASYRVFTSDSPSPFSPGHPTPSAVQPPLVQRSLVVTPALNTNASPNGWIDDADNETRGNNVDAHLDRDRDNQPDLPRPQGNPNRVFDFPLDLTQPPSTYGDASVVQLFYWCNFIHDKFWELGFNEAAGNFQNNNFGRGGLGNDAILADAQDGSGFNNANYTPAPDGFPPRIQMYVFNGPSPDRDGDFDAEVIIHEYAHGLSDRLVGGGVGISQLQTAGMGEGWSDWYPLTLLSEPGDDLGGNYAAGGYLTLDLGGLMENYYYGIRRYPYSTNLTKNPLTFRDIDPTQADPHVGVPISPIFPFNANFADEVHNQGEVWCVTLWEARANLINKHGYTNGNQLILQLVTDGMKLGPVDPNFLEARDAIIQADMVNNGGANFNELWAAFAKRGMGGSASSPVSSTTVGVVEAFDLPGIAFRNVTVVDNTTGNGNGAIDFNECGELLIAIVNNDIAPVANIRATLTTTTPGVTISQGDSLYPNLAGGALGTNVTPFRIYTAPSFTCGSPIDFRLNVRSDRDTRNLRFRVPTGLIGPPRRFDNFTPVPIPDDRVTGVDSVISVSGFSSALAKITVSLHITHPFLFDLSLQLIGPDGTSVVLSSMHGGSGDNYGVGCSPDTVRTTFDDKAANPIGAGRPPFVGTFRPDEALVAFVGKPASAVNGAWRLHVIDQFAFDVGTIQCWSLNLSPAVCVDGGGDCATDIAASGTNSTPVLVGSNLLYTIVVTNRGPNTARNVTVVDTLPSSVEFVSATSTRGTCAQTPGGVTCQIGTLARRDSATVQILVRPLSEGQISNFVAVTTSVVDNVATNDTLIMLADVRLPAPIIVADVVTLASETAAPPNGALDVGETVTLNFGLRNVGALSTSDLQVKLLTTGGVADASPQQSYGVLDPAGSAAYRPFTFRVATTNGGIVLATLQLQDGTNNLGTVVFAFGVSSILSFSSSSVITVPDSGIASLYPSRIFVSGISGIVNSVSVTLSNLVHTYPADLDVLLSSPQGSLAMIMSDVGGGNSVNGVSLSIADSAGAPLPQTTQLAPGSYRPADYEPGESLPAPAPPRPYSGSLGAFGGLNPNGFWSLYVADDTPGDQGRFNGGWAMTFQTIDPVNPEADLAVTIADVPDPVMIGSNLIYTVLVTNAGPEIAGEVLISNTLPANVTFVSAIATQGACSNVADRVVCHAGTLTNGAVVAISITVQPALAGTLSFSSTVSGNALDLHPANNAATALTTVSGAADLALSVGASSSPVFINNTITYTLTVSNSGPNAALGVALSNTLPADVSFISATASQGPGCSIASGVINCGLGTISSGASATVTVLGTSPSNVGLLTNRAGVRLTSPVDLNPANNSASAITTNLNPSFIIVTAGALLQVEASPATGGIEAGETVTMDLSLRNIGSADTANLTATLLPGGGVTAPSGPRNYGALRANGPSAARSFTFTAASAGSGMLVATLQLNEGSVNLGAVAFTFPLGSTTRFTSSAALGIPDNGKASVYPAPLPVSGMAGLITKVSATISNLSHSYPDDLDVLLVGPAGQNVLLLSDVGGANSANGVTLHFDDAAAAFLPDSAPLTSGLFKPTDVGPTESLPSPAPAAPYGTNLAVFNGTSPNGTWALYVFDDTFGDLGRIDGGWSLALTTVGRVNPIPASLTAPTALPGRIRFIVNGEAGATYMIQASSDLSTWVDVDTITLSGESAAFEEPRSQARRFYRATRQ